MAVSNRTAFPNTKSNSQASNVGGEQGSTLLTLPRYLPRPKYRAIDPLAVVAVNPVLADVPLSYIQHTLKEIGPKLFQATRNTSAKPPIGQLPEKLALICHDINIEPPSHILAIYSGACDHERVVLFPAHALVLVAGCANLSILPPSPPKPPATPDEIVTLPVVPLRIPSPATFSILLSYIYTRRLDTLLDELLPVYEETKHSLDELARKHAATFPLNELIGDARKVHGLWSNLSALGVFDDRLFSVLEFAWEVCLSALAIKTGKSIDVGGPNVKRG
ncbi:hypothetical protein BU17DRAFT_43466 [Hysterangium stoloniferum]|nr:hypothetical protein BU17DRAFT_43466 [Hysterangium stoloniferum]